MDLCLLADTLSVNIAVVRPRRYGNEDFISNYTTATDMTSTADTALAGVLLITDDDQHCNVLVP